MRSTGGFVSAVSCAFVLFIPAPAVALPVGMFYAKIETENEIIAGLDGPTRKFLLAMPEKIRNEMVELIRQALPLLEKSTIALLDHVDGLIEKNINHLVCTAQALGQGVAEEIGGVMTGDRPTPVKDLVEAWDKRITAFSPSSARALAINYEDFLHQSGITACRIADSSAAQRVSDIRADARQKWRVWSEIEKACSTPADCLGKRYAEVRSMVENADPRDRDQASASQALANVALVKPEEGLWARVKSALGNSSWAGVDAAWPAQEAELQKLRMIQRSLDASTALRQTVAKRRLTDSTAAILMMEAGITKAKAQLSNANSTANNQAKEAAQKALESKQSALEELGLALEGDRLLQDDVRKMKSRLSEVEKMANQVIEDADTKNKAIAVAAKKAERERELRKAERRDRLIVR